MDGKQLKRLREQQQWTQPELAEILNPALDRRYTGKVISQWENGHKPIPEPVSIFLTELGLGSILPPREPEPENLPPQAGDTIPEGGGPSTTHPPQQLLSRSSPYEEVCTQLWEIIATGIGMVGAATGNESLRKDGAIIDASKHKLGLAYAHLAETNATFRNMLGAMTTSGAWMEVGMVTGTVFAECWRNHQETRIIDGAVAPIRDADEPFADAA